MKYCREENGDGDNDAQNDDEEVYITSMRWNRGWSRISGWFVNLNMSVVVKGKSLWKICYKVDIDC